ncbi:hypothetical protein DSAG12_02650 [Promethearchaeum syntrophicum]|uniref:Uncharacterized protein n=1 Tax=Promethearchaeum syntrophicum TaxID=2594042 RepID=A0A5B9DDG7_9ARCH|nr:hypothetical protein [Candidatus Prometheoarchaeum syntrophicum]QEE16820.1 hypothetical protein DSAG12_02650 [Candidatus Prometheoarchaeum syntrophicum]
MEKINRKDIESTFNNLISPKLKDLNLVFDFEKKLTEIKKKADIIIYKNPPIILEIKISTSFSILQFLKFDLIQWKKYNNGYCKIMYIFLNNIDLKKSYLSEQRFKKYITEHPEISHFIDEYIFLEYDENANLLENIDLQEITDKIKKLLESDLVITPIIDKMNSYNIGFDSQKNLPSIEYFDENSIGLFEILLTFLYSKASQENQENIKSKFIRLENENPSNQLFLNSFEYFFENGFNKMDETLFISLFDKFPSNYFQKFSKNTQDPVCNFFANLKSTLEPLFPKTQICTKKYNLVEKKIELIKHILSHTNFNIFSDQIKLKEQDSILLLDDGNSIVIFCIYQRFANFDFYSNYLFARYAIKSKKFYPIIFYCESSVLHTKRYYRLKNSKLISIKITEFKKTIDNVNRIFKQIGGLNVDG